MTSIYIPYPDAELVTIALMEMIEEPGLQVGTWLPPGWEPPYIQVNRIGGGPDNSDITDYPLMRLAFYGPNRGASWNLAAAGEAVILAHRHRNVPVPGVGDILLDAADINIGGQQLPDLDPDDRRVVKDVLLGFRRQYKLLATP